MLRPTHVRQHVNFMRSREFNVSDVVAGTGIDAQRLDDPGYLVSVAQAHTLVTNMLRISNEPGLGLDVGGATHLTDFGIVGYAMASCATLGQGISLWHQYGNSAVGFPFTLKFAEDAGPERWGMLAASNGVSGAIYRYYVEQILAMGISLGRQLTGRAFEFSEIAFTYRAPDHVQRYEETFGCPLRFNAPQTRAIVRAPSLDMPIKTRDNELRELCIRHCSSLARQVSRHGDVTSRLRSALTSSGTIPTLDEAAEMLNISPRTLRRHLQAEDTTFQRVLDGFRTDLAREYLSAAMMPPKEVAFLLGFTDVDSFRRAFKSWTGRTIGEFQRDASERYEHAVPRRPGAEAQFAAL